MNWTSIAFLIECLLYYVSYIDSFTFNSKFVETCSKTIHKSPWKLQVKFPYKVPFKYLTNRIWHAIVCAMSNKEIVLSALLINYLVFINYHCYCSIAFASIKLFSFNDLSIHQSVIITSIKIAQFRKQIKPCLLQPISTYMHRNNIKCFYCVVYIKPTNKSQKILFTIFGERQFYVSYLYSKEKRSILCIISS